MRLNIRMIGWLFGLMVIALLGRMLLRIAPAADKARAGLFLMFGAALFVLGSLGRALGRVIQAAVSRQRERLADASAVQFTRNPQGLKGALLKIAAAPGAGRLQSARTDEVAHMLFVPGLNGLLATHPPLDERIVALDPGIPRRAAGRAGRRVPRAGSVGEQRRRRRPAAAPQPAADAACSGSRRCWSPRCRSCSPTRSAIPIPCRSPWPQELRLALPPKVSRPRNRIPGACPGAAARHARRARSGTSSAAQQLIGATLRRRRRHRCRRGAADSAGALPPPAAPAGGLRAVPGAAPLAARTARATGRPDRAPRGGRITTVDVFEFCLHRLVYNTLLDELEAREEHGRAASLDLVHPLGILFSVLAGAARRAPAFEAGLSRVLPGRCARPRSTAGSRACPAGTAAA